MTDVILVQPKNEEKPLFYQNPIKRIRYSYCDIPIPLGLLSISRYLVDRYKVKIIDQRIDKDWKRQLLKELNKSPLCLATTSTTTSEIMYALEVSRFTKRISDIPVILGGEVTIPRGRLCSWLWHPSLLPKQTLENPNVDIVIKGEGEITFFELIKRLEKNKDIKEVRGICFKDRGNIKINPNRPLLDLNKLPDIPYYLIDVKRYNRQFKGSLPLETSRGCINNCSFCINSNQPYRYLKTEKMIEQIRYLIKNYDIKHIFFSDDNFFLNYKRIKKFMRILIKDKIDITWSANGGINSISHYDLKLLQKSGCNKIFVGAESGSQRILNFINKNIKVNRIRDAYKKFLNSNICLSINFMMGFPNETEEDLKKTINLMFSLLNKNTEIFLSIYKPCPNTPLYSHSVKKGLKIPKSLIDWANLNQSNMPWIRYDVEKIDRYWLMINDAKIFPKRIRNYIQHCLYKKMLNILHIKCQN